MDGRIKFSSEKNKNKKKNSFDFRFSKKDIFLVLVFPQLVKLLTNENFLEFVVKIVKILLNRSFYYFDNNRIFIFNGDSYGT